MITTSASGGASWVIAIGSKGGAEKSIVGGSGDGIPPLLLFKVEGASRAWESTGRHWIEEGGVLESSLPSRKTGSAHNLGVCMMNKYSQVEVSLMSAIRSVDSVLQWNCFKKRRNKDAKVVSKIHRGNLKKS